MLKFIMAAEDPTAATLRKLRRAGKLSGQEIDSETARQLLKTPPSMSLHVGARLSPIGGAERRRSAAAVEPDGTLPDLVRNMEGLCEAFQTTLADNTRVTKEFMGRSLLQLFEDSVRERLPDALSKSGRGGGSVGFGVRTTNVVKQLNASRRPIDRGLDRKDHGSDIVIPDSLRDAIANDIAVIVEHELKRVLSSISTDIQHILQIVFQVKDRVSAVEEEMLQRQVDANMMTDQISSQAQQLDELQAEVALVREQLLEKDKQMDVLREQLSRRNEALDDTRVKFRKEVMRYKTRIYELQSEIDAAGRRKGGAAPQALERKQSIMPSAGGDQLDDDSQGEVYAATETAVKEATHRLQEQMRQMELTHIREKKLLMQEMNMKVLERDQEIIKWKDKVRQMQHELDEMEQDDGSL